MPKLMLDPCSQAEAMLGNEKAARRIGQRSVPKPGPWAILRIWIKDQLVGDVPRGVALCEFDCTKTNCSLGEWATCERRLARANGELWPSSPEDDPEDNAVGRRALNQ